METVWIIRGRNEYGEVVWQSILGYIDRAVAQRACDAVTKERYNSGLEYYVDTLHINTLHADAYGQSPSHYTM